MPKYLVRGWFNVVVEAEDPTQAEGMVGILSDDSSRELDDWGIEEVERLAPSIMELDGT